MKIRKATKKDFKEYLSMRKEGGEYFEKISGEKFNLTNKKIKKEFEDLIFKKNLYLFFLIVGGEIVGYLNILITKNRYEPVSYLNDFLVKKRFRGEGYGKYLLKDFIRFSKSKKVKKIGLGTRIENRKAIKLYKKLGFKIIGYNFGMKLK